MTGFSGMDVEGMVAQLMRAERVRHDRLFQQSVTLNWRQEAFISASNTLSRFQHNHLTNRGDAPGSTTATNRIGQRSSWTNNLLSNSSSNAVGVAGTSGARAGDFAVRVNRLATRDIFDSAGFSNAVGGTVDFNALSAGEFSVSFNGTSRAISISQADIDQINAAGPADRDGELQDILNERLQQAFGTASGSSAQRVSVSVAGGDIQFNLANPSDTIGVTSGTIDVESALGIDPGQSTNNMLNRNLSSVLGVSLDNNFTINGVSIIPPEDTNTNVNDMTVGQFLTLVNRYDNGVNMSFNAAEGRFVLQSTNTGTANAIEFGSDNFRTAFGFGGPREVAHDAEFTVNGQVFTSATNTGVTTGSFGLTLNLNEVTDGDVTITVRNNVQAAFDMIMDWMEGYNEMLRTLSGMTQEQFARSNTGARFLPLTEEQRSGMSDADIARWEEQARQGILRNDPTLQRIEQEMRRWIFEPVELSDGRRISLHEIGINTGSWRNGGQLELWENAAGNTVFTMELLEERFDDIMEMFTNSSGSFAWTNTGAGEGGAPGAQAQRMRENGISARLDDLIRNAIENDNSSINMAGGINRQGEVHPTNQRSPMNQQMREIQQRMADELIRMNRRENHFFTMFSRMEQAIMRSDQQMASLMASIGGGMM